MMKPIDMLGFGPKREVRDNGDGTFTIKVTPPSFVRGNGCEVKLTAEQYAGYQRWADYGVLIQDALPGMTGPQREMLMTGLSDEDFREATLEPEEDKDDDNAGKA